MAPGVDPGRGAMPRPVRPWGQETGTVRGRVDTFCRAPLRGLGAYATGEVGRSHDWQREAGGSRSPLSFSLEPTVWGHPGSLRASEEGRAKKLPEFLRRTGRGRAVLADVGI